jgi:two-component system nitrogen regulation sensor histidine kinase NtrY
MSERRRINKWWLVFGGGSLVLLAAAIFTLGSLKAPVHPERGNAFVILFALSTFIVAAFLVFGLILTRSLLRLWAERRAGQLGSRFKTKMVLGAMGISVIPVIFLFFISYALVNRTLILWFPRPLELANQQSKQLVEEMSRMGRDRLRDRAAKAGAWLDAPGRGRTPQAYLTQFASDIDALWTTGPGRTAEGGTAPLLSDDFTFHLVRTLPSGAEIWQGPGKLYLAGRAPYRGGGYVLAGRVLPDDFLTRYSESEAQTLTYEQQRQHLRAYKSEILLFLLLVTVLILFASTWVALFLSKQVTVPIQALAEATQEVAAGNLAHRVAVQAQDELGTLVNSFNQMTAQLGESRRQIDDFTRNLQVAIEEIERRRNLMEAILENIPTGVLSLDPNGGITRINSAVTRIFGERSRGAHTLGDLLGEEAARDSLQLMRRSLRMGVASRELEISVPGRLLHAAVTVSSLGPGRSNPGFVVVIDDLTELLRAQKAAAWQEVAQRIAHEIKNPLTPIQLSAQRLLRHLDRGPSDERTARLDFEKVVGECAALIEQEVQTLESLVDEFSQFARFPAAKLAPADLNGIVRSALDVFHGRLEGIAVRTEFAGTLPPVRADAELLRRVFVNLIDNAAEALEGATTRTLTVATRLDQEGDAVEIEVSDSGHGISPEDKDKLFLPHFSTKDRGTGLGLAIASRIVAEHHGTIKAEDNSPSGTRFLIRFPVAEVPAAQPSSRA